MAQIEAAKLDALRYERICLESGPPNMKPLGLGTVALLATCDGNSQVVLDRVKHVLNIINVQSDNWPAQSVWRQVLPDWLVEYCTEDMSSGEMEKWLAWWRNLPDHEQVKAQAALGWSLGNWLYWLEPQNRQWFWWDASVVDIREIQLAVVVMDWPFPWRALGWLFKAAGADDLIEKA